LGQVVHFKGVKVEEKETFLDDLVVSAMQYAPFGMVIVGPDALPVYMNRTLTKWLDRPFNELMPEAVSKVFHYEDRDVFAHALEKVLLSGRCYRSVELRLAGAKHRRSAPEWVSVNLSRCERQGKVYVLVQMVDITEIKAQQAELTKLATRDHLTGVSNRFVFEQNLDKALQKAKRATSTGAVLFVDLDHFKMVNDTYGHKAGDAILTGIGRVLQQYFRAGDTVARIGGDEFAIILENVSSEEAYMKADLLAKAVASISVTAHGQIVKAQASVGVKIFEGNARADEIVAAADEAMYTRKRAQKARNWQA
jgi:diguanylate cyclase (GGDEF)-like protein/PAS domain S-box-containing protein